MTVLVITCGLKKGPFKDYDQLRVKVLDYNVDVNRNREYFTENIVLAKEIPNYND
jgi:hypothetical protein